MSIIKRFLKINKNQRLAHWSPILQNSAKMTKKSVKYVNAQIELLMNVK